MNLSLFSVKKTTQELSIQVTSSVLLPSKLQACTWAFCNGIPLALSMRHRFTVAGNYERLFFCFFDPDFFATKLLHEVCLKTNTENYLGYEERNTVIIQSIVLVFGAPRVCS